MTSAEIAIKLLKGETCKNCFKRRYCPKAKDQLPCENWDILVRVGIK
jgi:hypothetical protein